MKSKELSFFFISTLKFTGALLLMYFIIVFILCNVKLNGKPAVFRACQGMVWKGGYTYERFKEFNPDADNDILIFGSSRANRGINPKVFESYGYSSYNLGTDDQTPINTEVLVKHFVRPDKCRLVIIDIYDKVFAQPDLESTADLVQNVNSNVLAANMAIASRDIRALNALSVRLTMYKSSPLYEGETDLYKGFRALHDDSVSFAVNHKTYKTLPGYMESLTRTINYLKSINMPFLLVSQPMVFNKQSRNHSLFLEELNVVLETNKVAFYDLSEQSEIVTKNEYADECHLQLEGANNYSKYLMEHLISKTNLPSRK